MKKRILFIALSSLFVVSCAELNSTLNSVNETLNSINPNMKMQTQAKNVSAKTICRDLRENALTAKEKWTNTYVSLSGTVSSVDQSAWGGVDVNFNIGNDISILTTPAKNVNVRALKVGQKKKIKGIVRSMMDTGSCRIFLANATF